MTATVDTLIVRPYVGGDRSRLLDLLRQVWSYKRNIERHVDNRWWWQRADPPLFVVEDPERGNLVGLCAYLPCALRIGGRETECAWFVDFYVLADYQGRGLGKRLTRAVQDRFAVTASLSQTEMAYRVFQKLGWGERTAVQLSVHPLPHRWMFPRASGGLKIETREIDGSLPNRSGLDSLWARLQDAYPVIARRSGADILDRYAPQGDRQYSILLATRGSECVGYMIVRAVRSASDRSIPPQGLIVDCLTHPADSAAFSALLGEASAVLTRAGAKRLFCLSTVPGQQKVLGSCGFLSPETPLLGRLVRGNAKWLTCVTSPQAPQVNPAEWYLTLGDCDIDYAWKRD